MAARTTKKKAATEKKWKVMEAPVAYAKLWAAYKLKDETKNDVPSNRTIKGGFWSTKKEAQDLADRYNEEGK